MLQYVFYKFCFNIIKKKNQKIILINKTSVHYEISILHGLNIIFLKGKRNDSSALKGILITN